jgi:hypothetical protein
MGKSNEGVVIPKLRCENCGFKSSNYDEASFYGNNMNKLPAEHLEYYLTEGLNKVKHSLCKDCVIKRLNNLQYVFKIRFSGCTLK